jgi:hypothetical protein
MAEEGIHCADRGNEIPMCNADTLGVASAAAGVHDACHGVRLWPTCLEGLDRLGPAKVPQFGDAEHLDVADTSNVVENGLFRIPVVQDVLDGRGLGKDFQYSGEKFGICEETDAAGLVE